MEIQPLTDISKEDDKSEHDDIKTALKEDETLSSGELYINFDK